MLTIDGRSGEGGGQILRTSLSLSLITGQPFRMTAIRARRKTPGLMRQHLTAVLAAAEVGGAQVEGASIGSTELTFRPGAIKAGEHRFAVGTAGSATLIFQALLPALLRAPGPSTLKLEGGTHNPMAPPFDFLDRVFLPMVRRMGIGVQAELHRWGFYPAGGGSMTFSIEPWALPRAFTLLERGAERGRWAAAAYAGIPFDVARRELEALGPAWPEHERRPLVVRSSRGPGNALIAGLRFEHIEELFCAFGEKGKPAEQVVDEVLAQVAAYEAHGAPVGEHLADQLLLPMAMGKGGAFRTGEPSQHTLTQIETIRRFLPARIACEEVAARVWQISVDP